MTPQQGDLFTFDTARRGINRASSPQVGKHHRDAGKTELKAAFGQIAKSGTQRYRILEALVRAGSQGMTRWELVGELDLLMSSVCGRLSQLADDRFARQSDRERVAHHTGNAGHVWYATQRGIRAIKGQETVKVKGGVL